MLQVSELLMPTTFTMEILIELNTKINSATVAH